MCPVWEKLQFQLSDSAVAAEKSGRDLSLGAKEPPLTAAPYTCYETPTLSYTFQNF
jgi:hypothetical protein